MDYILSKTDAAAEFGAGVGYILAKTDKTILPERIPPVGESPTCNTFRVWMSSLYPAHNIFPSQT